MEKNYISEEDVKRLLDYYILTENWDYYFIVYNLTIFGKKFSSIKKMDINQFVLPNNIKIPEKNPFYRQIRTINKQFKIHAAKARIRDVNISTKIFTKKFMIGGKLYYGVPEKEIHERDDNEYGFLYVLKHTHRDDKLNSMLTDKKIGISNNCNRRIKELTLGTVGIEVLKTWKIKNRMIHKIEKKIHSKLIERRLIGEWFSDEVNTIIDEVDNIIHELNIV
jgi:hypothetical protein